MINEETSLQSSDLILIRHAQSTYNEATIVTAGEMGLTGVWDDYIKSDVFNQRVTYNERFIDAPLSEHGKHQCENAQNELKNKDIDLILVSPQIRALETCERIFGGRNIPVIVEPHAMEVFRYSCDVSAKLQIKKTMFPEYDFSKVEKLGQEWYLDMLPADTKELVLRDFKEKELETVEDKQRSMLDCLSQKTVYEHPKDLRSRVGKLKQILSEYREKYKTIVVVAHYYTIEFIKSTGFREDGNLQEYQGIINCYPYYEKLEDLMKVQ